MKTVLYVFNGDPMCFIHVLLNALDMQAKDFECRIVVEGSATKLIPELAGPDHPLNKLWEKTKAAGLVEALSAVPPLAEALVFPVFEALDNHLLGDRAPGAFAVSHARTWFRNGSASAAPGARTCSRTTRSTSSSLPPLRSTPRATF